MADWGKILSRGSVEDRRSLGATAAGGLSLTGVAVLFVVNYLMGGDVGDFLTQLETVPIETSQVAPDPAFEGQDAYEVFAATVLGSNNDMWESIFSQNGQKYTEPKLVLFRSATQSACGVASSRVGPHYCPLDQTIYLDETFFEELQSRFGARGGDVAEAYVIAHEVGHHIQNQLGILDDVQSNTQYGLPQANQLSIQLELQADCFAGMWAYSIRDLDVFQANEIEEAMDAAEAVGDDRIQETVNGYISPENWTHGSSEERKKWFNTGFQSGSFDSCNTFRSP